ncbi:Uncharacterised protein [Serratia plymuthica]|nr:Uncharacterised protein [Serratia plymuthica]
MKFKGFKSGSRLAIPAIFAALFLVASTVTLYYYSATLSKKGLYAIAGTQENYSWSIAKFAIKLAEFETLVEQQKMRRRWIAKISGLNLKSFTHVFTCWKRYPNPRSRCMPSRVILKWSSKCAGKWIG